jgi:hypothetical protein
MKEDPIESNVVHTPKYVLVLIIDLDQFRENGVDTKVSHDWSRRFPNHG